MSYTLLLIDSDRSSNQNRWDSRWNMSLVQTKLPDQCLGATVSKWTDMLLSDHHHRYLGNSALALERAIQWRHTAPSHSDIIQRRHTATPHSDFTLLFHTSHECVMCHWSHFGSNVSSISRVQDLFLEGICLDVHQQMNRKCGTYTK